MPARPSHAPTLRELQRWMAALIVGEQPLGARADGGGCADLIEAGNDSAVERLGVYARGYPARIQEALEEQFPALAHITGAASFSALARRYTAATPLHSYNLNDASAALPRFLAADPLSTDLPFLPDLARLELAVARAFHAASESPLDPAPLAGWTNQKWERARLRFQPWVAVVTSDWPIREIWGSREIPIEQIDIDLNGRPDSVLVRRDGDAVVCESLERDEVTALGALLGGQTLGGLMAILGAGGEDPAVVSRWFAHWLARRVLVSCES